MNTPDTHHGAHDFNGAVLLADWGLIRAAGPDARSFLQGQLTQDVVKLPLGRATLAGYCSPKGRLLASFVVWPAAEDELLLACSADLLPAALKRLSMYVLRAKCKLGDASGELRLWGASGAQAQGLAPAVAAPWQTAMHGGTHWIRLPDALPPAGGDAVPRYLVCTPADQAAPALPPLAPAHWQALEALSGVARITAATSEQFVPQMVNLELVGGVNFQKGCYPGQEIVARSQYRGTLKRRAFVLQAQAPAAPGQEVFHSADAGQPAGMVVLAGSLGDGQHHLLAELKLSAVAEGSLHLGRADGPLLTLGRQPYELPAAAEA